MGSDGVVRLSISPSQGDDPGFKSRSEQFFMDILLDLKNYVFYITLLFLL
jgi:hypothetical protein